MIEKEMSRRSLFKSSLVGATGRRRRRLWFGFHC